MKKVYLVDRDRCSLDSCGRPCIEKCPVVISGKKKRGHEKKKEIPIRFKKSSGEIIIKSEFCLKCGICANVCPMDAIFVKNIIEEDESRVKVHEFSSESKERGFRLYGLPLLKNGTVVGLCGPNGIGKSTVLSILAGNIIPNFGDVEEECNELDWSRFTNYIKEHELRAHFDLLRRGIRKISYKKQVLRILFERFKGRTIKEILKAECDYSSPFFRTLIEKLDIGSISSRYLTECSGGELQRFALALMLGQDADVYLIDEPCTFLDVKKRIELGDLIMRRARDDTGSGGKIVLVVEHDLAILDYLSDFVHLFYGIPHEFGVITRALSTKAGINSYLNGFVKTENVEFRSKKISFRRTIGNRSWENARIFARYGAIEKKFKTFTLKIRPGIIYESEILGVVGENGLGKSTFAKILAGKIKPDYPENFIPICSNIAYKPQYITRENNMNVKEFIASRSGNYDFTENMLKILYRPLNVDKLFNKHVTELSGGELQRVYIVSCLATRADLYILDEPSAYLDVEERLHVSSVIRSITKHSHATTVCIEHDIQIADSLADRLLIFTGTPGKEGQTIGPLNKRDGMNTFLKLLDITFRRDDETGRARINKKGSTKDRYQRATEQYFHEL
ncbi:MAG: ribosome biogenesis/translation initiation ATPase RLI [Promethearchaeota archaeon]